MRASKTAIGAIRISDPLLWLPPLTYFTLLRIKFSSFSHSSSLGGNCIGEEGTLDVARTFMPFLQVMPMSKGAEASHSTYYLATRMRMRLYWVANGCVGTRVASARSRWKAISESSVNCPS